jgi:hypothetical protein
MLILYNGYTLWYTTGTYLIIVIQQFYLIDLFDNILSFSVMIYKATNQGHSQ